MGKFIKNSDWSKIDSNQLCRIIDFTPSTGLSSRATLEFECKDYPNGVIGYVYHKDDFDNLSEAISMNKQNPNSEIIFFWSKKQYKNFLYKILSPFFPRFWIMLCPVNSYELHTKNDYHPEITGQARFMATEPIKEWKPSVMK